MNKEYLFLLLYFLIKGHDAVRCHNLNAGPHCDRSEVGPTITSCFELMHDKQKWNDAVDKCAGLYNGSLASAVPYKEKEQLEFFEQFALTTRLWIGLNDNNDEGSFVYTNGFKLSVSFWNPNEPDGKRKQNCAFFQIKKKLADDNCTNPRNYLCQRESKIGPRELNVVVDWHDHHTKLLYDGMKASATCSVFSPMNGKIIWAVLEGDTKLDIKKTFTDTDTSIRHELETTEYGQCGNKTYSTFSFRVNVTHQNLQLVCYPRPSEDGNQICPMVYHRYAYCRRSEKLKVESVIRGLPNISISYPGMPGLAEFRNTVVCIKCIVPTSNRTDSIIIINYPGTRGTNSTIRREQPPPSLLHRNIEDTPGGRIDVLVLRFTFNKTFDNVTFSCFARNVEKEGSTKECRSDNKFCVTAGPIPSSTTSPNDQGPRNTSLTLQLHIRPNYVFVNTIMNVSCSALDAYGDNLTWKAFDVSQKEVDISPNINSSETFHQLDEGSQTRKTTTKLSLQVTESINGSQLSCYSDAYQHTAPCNNTQTHLKYCDSGQNIIVTSKPYRPELRLWYAGYPSAATSGSDLNISCIVSSASEFLTLKWLIYNSGHQGTILVDNNASIVQSYNMSSSITENSTEPNHQLQSTLRIPMKVSMNGTSIGCFAYDITLDNPEVVCTASNDLCQRSEPLHIKVDEFEKPRKKQDPENRQFIATFVKPISQFIGIMVVLQFAWILLFKILFCRADVQRPGEDGVAKLEDEPPLALQSKPIKKDISTPTKVAAPVQIKVDVPISSNVEAPIPGKVGVPIPSKVGDPIPSKAEAPILSKAEAPIPSKAEAPISGKAGVPIPSKIEAPIPGKVGVPIPTKVVAPIPGKVGVPIPTKVQAPIPVKVIIKPSIKSTSTRSSETGSSYTSGSGTGGTSVDVKSIKTFTSKARTGSTATSATGTSGTTERTSYSEV